MPEPKEISLTQFARIVGISPQRAGELARLGMPCAASRGKGVPRLLSSAKALRWFIQREAAKHLARDGGAPLSEARRCRAAAEARIAHARATAAENAVIDSAEARAIIREMLRMIDARLDELTQTIDAERLAGESDPAIVHAELSTVCRDVRAKLARDFEAAAAEAASE